MSPKNQWLEDVFPCIFNWKSPFFGDMLIFGGVIFFSQNQLLETAMKILAPPSRWCSQSHRDVDPSDVLKTSWAGQAEIRLMWLKSNKAPADMYIYICISSWIPLFTGFYTLQVLFGISEPSTVGHPDVFFWNRFMLHLDGLFIGLERKPKLT